MNKSYFFISDIHLGLEDREKEKSKEKILVDFLHYAAQNCDELFIVGDLFDYWFEYKRVYQKGYFRTLTALQDFTLAGKKLHYFIGNHDFMHRNFFQDEIGAIMYHNAEKFILNDKKFFIGHGDGLVDNDTGYNILKKIFRNKTLQKLYSFIHPDLGVGLASRTSKTSREYTTKKDYGEADGLFNSAKKKIDEGFDFVLFGHLHQRCYIDYKKGLYVNLGSWLTQPCYGKFDGKEFEIPELK
ncbi:MAG: UDP-2,3-diacylglucosamine diphosphatase [Ignavibacteriales bacterium]|nr:MAG: UDP-2,3-diacylglucosamine diphosphatase [Ignavibacteriales bacterium]